MCSSLVLHFASLLQFLELWLWRLSSAWTPSKVKNFFIVCYIPCVCIIVLGCSISIFFLFPQSVEPVGGLQCSPSTSRLWGAARLQCWLWRRRTRGLSAKPLCPCEFISLSLTHAHTHTHEVFHSSFNMYFCCTHCCLQQSTAHPQHYRQSHDYRYTPY